MPGKQDDDRPRDKKHWRVQLFGALNEPMHPWLAEQIRKTPDTGHFEAREEGKIGKLIANINSWPADWLSQTARNRLKQAIAAGDDAYAYYQLGADRPSIWYDNKRWTLEDFDEKYGRG